MTITASFNFSYQKWSTAAGFLPSRAGSKHRGTHHIRDNSRQQEVLLVFMRALLITHQ